MGIRAAAARRLIPTTCMENEKMGVARTDYLIYGAKVDYDAVDYDKHGAEMEGRPGAAFDLIVDNMGGKYAVAGKVIARRSMRHQCRR
jgi:hypothetical protein